MESPRLPRFDRSQEVAPIHLEDRDIDILRIIHRHRFLRSSHIIDLIGGSRQQILRRLQLLFHNGYLERPRAQIDYYHHGGTREIVYGLGNKGEAWLARELGIVSQKLRCGEKNRAVRRMFLEHALMVSDIIVAIELACRKNGNVRLLMDDALPRNGSETPPRNRLFRWKVNIPGKGKIGVIPDRVFALERSDESGQRDLAYFFLEADRGTMPVIRRDLSQTSMQRKLLAYEATWSQSIHRTQFGFHRFRVLTVTNSAARLESLVDACSQLERGHGLFLFADRSVLQQEDILSALWHTTKPGETGSLLN